MLNQLLSRLSGKAMPFSGVPFSGVPFSGIPSSAIAGSGAADSSQLTSGRTEICPPALRRSTQPSGWQESWQAGLRDWLQSAWPTSTLSGSGSKNYTGHVHGSNWPKTLAVTLQSSTPLSLVRREFMDSLRDVRTQQAGDVLGRIRIARSMRELWHLRIDVYNVVARHRDEQEATYRLNRLNRFFPQRVGRPSVGTRNAPVDRRSAAR